jgi:hypothetical protein
MAEGTLIASFCKNALEEVRAQIVHYKGYELVDIRVWVRDRKDGANWIATKKGLSLDINLLPELEKMISAVVKFDEQRS